MISIIQKTSRFDRSYKKLTSDQKEDFRVAMRLFVAHPFNPKLDTHKLHGILKGLWSFSINYSGRVVFQFLGENTIMLKDIGDHDIYQ